MARCMPRNYLRQVHHRSYQCSGPVAQVQGVRTVQSVSVIHVFTLTRPLHRKHLYLRHEALVGYATALAVCVNIHSAIEWYCTGICRTSRRTL